MSEALPLPLQFTWLIPIYGFSGMVLSLPWATGWIKRNGPRPAAYLNLLVTLLAVVHGSLVIRDVLAIGPQHLEFAWFSAADLDLRLGFDLSLTNLAALELVTTMSLVCESSVGAVPGETPVTAPSGVFVSEKSLKPMAMQHPFIVIATPGTLAEIQSFGFETFPELWDESYDSIVDFDQRLNVIIQQVQQFDPAQLNQPIVQQKLEHNQHRIFDPAVTRKLRQQQVLDPILEFLNE